MSEHHYPPYSCCGGLVFHTEHCPDSPSIKLGNSEQPQPTANATKPIADLVMADLEARKRLGAERYGTPLQAHNGRDALRDAYEEALDLAIYLRQAIEKRGTP